MRRIDWDRIDEAQRRDALRRPAQRAAAALTATVAALIADVIARGDAALRELTLCFDGVAFAYADSDGTPVLSGISLSVAPVIVDRGVSTSEGIICRSAVASYASRPAISRTNSRNFLGSVYLSRRRDNLCATRG